MKVKHFLSALEHQRIHQAIQSAEEGSSGRIVVYISHRNVADPLAAAHHAFRKLKLETDTDDTDKNNLLIFVAPKTRKIAVVGGTALHEKIGQTWWDDLIALLTRHFKEGRYTDGLVDALQHAGQTLKSHFPSGTPHRHARQDIVEE
ncbi:MAG: TPM domain-containing protein [Methylacidiphilales bacterium]|nr:TPM domain-containing protein [Candidatus Methylacidiphilales bacterium]